MNKYKKVGLKAGLIIVSYSIISSIIIGLTYLDWSNIRISLFILNVPLLVGGLLLSCWGES